MKDDRLISLNAAIDEIKAVFEWHDVVTEDRLIQHFKALPSAQPSATDTNVGGNLIDRRAAIGAFDGVKVDEQDCTEYDIGYNDGIDFAVSRLSVLPSAQPGWIPCSERLPEPRVDVWVNSDIGQIQGYYEEHISAWYASFGQGRDYLELIVNAWMPLPAPYIPEGDDKHEE